MAAVASPAARGRRGLLHVGRLPALLLSAVLLAAVAGVGLFQVLQTSRAASAGYEIRNLERERDLRSARVRLLEAEVAGMAQVARVREQATTRLGMVPPQRSVSVAVSEPAPRVAPLPARYVSTIATPAPIEEPWWVGLVGRIPGFN